MSSAPPAGAERDYASARLLGQFLGPPARRPAEGPPILVRMTIYDAENGQISAIEERVRSGCRLVDALQGLDALHSHKSALIVDALLSERYETDELRIVAMAETIGALAARLGGDIPLRMLAGRARRVAKADCPPSLLALAESDAPLPPSDAPAPAVSRPAPGQDAMATAILALAAGVEHLACAIESTGAKVKKATL